MQLISSGLWNDYELLDSGNFEKLERFGSHVLIRPEPQAVWNPSMSIAEWKEIANALFTREKGADYQDLKNSEKGKWITTGKTKEQWTVNYSYKKMNFRLRLGLTGFGHIGVFPEQSDNWNYIYDSILSLNVPQPKVLNLFAYTGAASLAAKSAGADTVHVDASKPVVNWAHENMDASGIDGIRWVVEDVTKFVQREVKRGNTYHGIILDPPAYGRGPSGEKWLLEESINQLVALCAKLLEPTNNFFIINLYSLGFSALVLDNLISSHFSVTAAKESGELYVSDKFGKKLPLGTFLRFCNAPEFCPQ